MPKRTDGTSRSPGQEIAAPPPPLPDLTGISLRALRTSDDPAVAAAVDSALRGTEQLTRVWRSSGTQGGSGGRDAVPGRTGLLAGRDAFRSTSRPGGDSAGPR